MVSTADGGAEELAAALEEPVVKQSIIEKEKEVIGHELEKLYWCDRARYEVEFFKNWVNRVIRSGYLEKDLKTFHYWFSNMAGSYKHAEPHLLDKDVTRNLIRKFVYIDNIIKVFHKEGIASQDLLNKANTIFQKYTEEMENYRACPDTNDPFPDNTDDLIVLDKKIKTAYDAQSESNNNCN